MSFVNRKQFPWGFAARSGCGSVGLRFGLSDESTGLRHRQVTTLVAAPLPVARTAKKERRASAVAVLRRANDDVLLVG